MIDLSMYARRLEAAITKEPPNFGQCRAILTEAEHAWNEEAAGRDVAAAEKLEMSIADVGISNRVAAVLEDNRDAIYVRDLVGLSALELLSWPRCGETAINEIRRALGEEFCEMYGIAYTEIIEDE